MKRNVTVKGKVMWLMNEECERGLENRVGKGKGGKVITIGAYEPKHNFQQLLIKRTRRKKGEQHYQGFKERNQVWLEEMNLQLSHPSAKLALKQYGSFKVLKVISPVVFRLKLPLH